VTKEAHRQRSGPLIYALLIIVVYTIMSVAIAIRTSDECGGFRGEKKWVLIPPRWDCDNTLPGYQ
jgi:hypothetical protein